MGEHFIFRIKGIEYEGMRIPSRLYSAMLTTVFTYKQKEFPYILAENAFKKRTIRAKSVEDFKKELLETGNIVLANPLVNYELIRDNKIIVLEKTFNQTQLAVRIATAVELCNDAISRNKGVVINEEDGNSDDTKLSLEQKIRVRDNEWVYTPKAKSVFDYKTRN